MNIRDYLRELEQCLMDLPEEERRAAMVYYEDFLYDTNPEQLPEVLRKLGSPQQVAQEIRRGMNRTQQDGIWTEQGYESRTQQEASASSKEALIRFRRRGEHRDGIRKLLLIAVVFFVVMGIGIPILSTVGSILAALVVVALIVGFGGYFLVAVLMAAGVGMIFLGIIRIFFQIGMGLSLFGGGMIIIAAGLMLIIPSRWLRKEGIPGLGKAVGRIRTHLKERRS